MKLYESNVIISQNGEEAFPLYFIYPENNLNAYMCGLFSRRPQKKKKGKKCLMMILSSGFRV